MIAFAYYLLKVVIGSGVLFLYYHLALRNKLFHQWNRFYLLCAVALSLIAPVIQINIVHSQHEASNKAIQLLQVINSADGYMEEITITSQKGISSEQWILLGYSMISFVIFVLTVLSLIKIFSLIRSHSIRWIQNIKFINTNAKGTPFSFFKFIFWNNEIDLQTETGKQIFQHELVHVKEKHTADKLFMELILVIFWCNPFFWLIRRELKLIHEFIADKKSVGEHGAAALAAMILNASYPSQFNSLTNQFFQTSIKRRLAMLSKIQNPKINYLSRILALPILTLLILAFTLKPKKIVVPSLKLGKEITVVIDAGHGLMPDGKYNGARVDNIYEDDITLAIANKIKELNTNDKIKIVLTRPTNESVDLRKRVDIAKENNADLFISIHVSAAVSNQNPDLVSKQSLNKGFEIYVSGKQTVFKNQNELLGSALLQELALVYSINSSLLQRRTGVWVLDQNVCPSVLLECGFLTDEKDRAFITKETNQTAVAQKILTAIAKYAANQQTINNLIDNAISQSKMPTDNKTEKANLKLETENPPLYIVDGKEASKDEVAKIAPSKIESINVLKAKSATDKYGSKGANGVIEIYLKPHDQPLYIVDGKEIRKSELNNISPSEIQTINVLKDKSATDKYGAKGVNGVIEIFTRSFANLRDTIVEVTLKPTGDAPSKIYHQQNPNVVVKEVILTNPAEKKVRDTLPKTEPVFQK